MVSGPAAMQVDGNLDRLRDIGAADSLGERLRLVRQIGAGGMGRVFQAVDTVNGQSVAVKLFRTARGASDLGRFSSEAEILETLDHPAIVAYVGHGTTPDGDHYLAMSWLDGEHLGERLVRGPLSIDETLVLAQRLTSGLAAAHKAGVIHRDLKPGNIVLVGGDVASATLVDFGIARRAGVEGVTRTGELVGTPGYMAPEQIRGKRDIDGRADLFGLGCVLYHCLAGSAPFEADEMMTTLARLLLEQPAPLRSVRKEVPPRLEHLITRLLAKDEAHRPASADEVIAELDAIAAGVARGDQRALAAPRRGRPSFFPPARPALSVRPAVPPARWRERVALAVAIAAMLVAASVAVVASRDDIVRFERARASAGASAPCDATSRLGCAARCDAGDAEACFRDGEGRAFGLGELRRQPRAGVASLAEACHRGVGRACDTAAAVLLAGDTGPVDAAMLERLLRDGCDAGAATACARLGAELRSDDDVLPARPRAAFRLLARACELDDRDGCRMLAELHRSGTGTEVDPAEARRLLGIGCARGDGRACAELSRLCGRTE
jgi:hypothetical protein